MGKISQWVLLSGSLRHSPRRPVAVRPSTGKTAAKRPPEAQADTLEAVDLIRHPSPARGRHSGLGWNTTFTNEPLRQAWLVPISGQRPASFVRLRYVLWLRRVWPPQLAQEAYRRFETAR